MKEKIMKGNHLRRYQTLPQIDPFTATPKTYLLMSYYFSGLYPLQATKVRS